MSWYEMLDQKIEAYLPHMELRQEAPMSRYTSFHIGGPARRMAFPASGEELVLLENFARECGANPLIIGNGTNLLAPDEGLNRLVINTAKNLHDLEVDEKRRRIRAEGGVLLSRLADMAQKKGLTGLEFAHGIPGTVGGAVCMNAGAYGGEMSQVIESVCVLDPVSGVRTYRCEEMDFAYRRSVLTDHPEWVVLFATFRLEPGDPVSIRAQMEELMARRRASQPLEYPSAGSTFKRPEGSYAGTLIDQCGLKGLTVGGAQVSPKHAGFIINMGEATFADVTALIGQVQQRVFEEKGVRLEPEVKILKNESIDGEDSWRY